MEIYEATMDVWLLAAQLTLSGAATFDPPPPTAPKAVAIRSAKEGDGCELSMASLAEVMADCATPAVTAIADPRAPRAPARSMSAAAARWPQPEQMMTPRHPATPQYLEQLRPVTGAQLYQFRAAALQSGDLYTQASPYHYLSQWQRAFDSPTYDQWQGLLAAEAAAMAHRQGQAPLTVVVGDSLALWLPVDELPTGRLWLNQSISGETTTHMLRRLHYFAATQPREVHILAGINDLKQGATEAEVVDNIYQMLNRLKQQHPQAELMLYSILPTRLPELPSDRIQQVNNRLAALAAAQGATFVDLYPSFSDRQGQLRAELTTDGLHLSSQGYALWRTALAGNSGN